MAPATRARESEAVARAEALLVAARGSTQPAERRRSRRLGRLLADPDGRELLFALTDEVLRTTDAGRAIRRLGTLLDSHSTAALGPLDRSALALAPVAGRLAPHTVARMVRARVRAETRGVIVAAEDPAFARHLARRRAEGIDVNVNLLGEAILGDDEASARLDAVCERVRRADVTCVSIKVSALCANLDVLAYAYSVDQIAQRLRVLFRTAMAATPPALVYLDMEEYRDLHLTVDAFQRVLDEPEFRAYEAGIALQAYLPDSHGVLDRLCHFAEQRRRSGGAPIRVRLVKGANLAMEQVDAALAGWAQAPYTSKADVDASYKRMLDRALDAAAAGALHVGVASHNLFDIAWALSAREERSLAGAVEIEMLEGMAPPQARAVRAAAGGLLLYTPAVASADYPAAIAYLSRRLDENAAPENFLRALFTITPGSAAWRSEERRFRDALAARHTVGTAPRRLQDRRMEQRVFDPDAPFTNEPDTDFTSAANREWITHHLAADSAARVPAAASTTDEVDACVERASAAARTWASTTTAERRAVLAKVAAVMAANRGRTIAVMAREGAKTVHEGDTEVSEAIDFARWAAAGTHELDTLTGDGVTCAPLGTVLVAGPWNFPYAIPANGIVSALAAGNAVILKPAPEAVATAVELVRHVHAAGVPADAVQLMRTNDDDIGRHLVTHPGIATVLLTGSYDTAQLFTEWNPQLRLIGETSGKNALVITSGADLDLAIRDLVRSAFGHAGQKCSAASLAIVENGLLDHDRFLTRLADAVRSVRVGAATRVETMMGPLVQSARGPLERAFTTLERGESWLVEPRPLDRSGHLWSPGVRVGVCGGSWFQQTECFGPVLGIMRARDLDHALDLQNGTPFGLTGGVHTLDPDEIAHWTAHVEVGNAYVNRHITGAIVGRQPFGGWKRSAVGPGAKTGGPNDVLRLTRCTATVPSDARAVDDAFSRAWTTTFGVEHDRTGLQAEANVFRYRPLDRVIVRARPSTPAAQLAVLTTAARVAGVATEVCRDESDHELAARIATTGAQRLRVFDPIDDALARACRAANIVIDDTPVSGNPRVELPRWLHEQAVSRTLHRHGRVPGHP